MRHVLTRAVLHSITHDLCEVIGRASSRVEETAGIFEFTMDNLK